MRINMLKGTITQLENGSAAITLSNGQILNIQVSEIEGVPAVGASVSIIVAMPNSEDAARQRMAKDVLNEFLGN